MAKDLLWQHAQSYVGTSLDVATVDADPIVQFRSWFREAEAIAHPDVNSMTLATADGEGRPSARIVLLKEIDERGLVFYTNYDSRKAAELERNPHAALVFYWNLLHRQVRVEGTIERVSAAESDAYFAQRPRGSRLGAIASPQSRVIASRAELEERFADLEREYADAEPPRPAWWGGYRVLPSWVELWQGQPSRLHDRVVYQLVDGAWIRQRLAP